MMSQILRRAIVESQEFNLSTKFAWKRYQEMEHYTEGVYVPKYSIRGLTLRNWESILSRIE